MARKPADPSKSKNAQADGDKPSRIAQIRMVARIVREANPRALPLIALTAVGVIAVFTVVGLVTGLTAFLIPIGVMGGVLAAVIMFGRFAQSAQFSQIEGQPGAAAAVLQSLRGNWTVTPAVAGNRNMDVVHRVVGRAGVVLVGEGNPTGLSSLLATEKKRVSRVAFDVPIYDIQVGNAEGQVPIRKLNARVMKLPRNMKGAQVSELNYRLKALPQAMQAPRGPLPKGARMPKGPRNPRMR
jgi:Domain of unknown function (DUF4191)